MAADGIDLPGIGPKRMTRLERNLGGEAGVRDALERGDVAALASVPGISRNRAIEAVQSFRGQATDWLRTDDAQALAHAALAPFLERTVTPLGKARIETLAPTIDQEALEARLETANQRLDALADTDLDALRDPLGRIQPPTDPRPSPEHDVTVLVDEEEDLADRIREAGFDRWVDLANGEHGVETHGLVLAATTGRTPPGAIHIPAAEPWEAVPWPDQAWAETNRDLLTALNQLAAHLDTDNHAEPILDALAQANASEPVDLEDAARACIEEANEAIEAEIEDVTLEGRDVLEVMQGGTSQTVESLIQNARADAREAFHERTGLVGAPFTDEYPLEINPRKLDELEREQRQDRALTRYRSARTVAETVRAHREGIQAMVREAIELDQWQAIADTAQAYGLTVPTLGDELQAHGALHLNLEGKGERVDYPVPNGVALLTGANSGGKTTLLETLGQIAYLAHLGLPVPATRATVPLLDGLAYYERPRQLGAGAFEGFLRTIEDVLLSPERVMVLADELEAMTELEAAAAILAEVVTRLDERDVPAVLVTHLAPYILEHVDARTDGIEAKGLNEDNELVVDRTPKLDYVARSTPELILQRLRNTAQDDRAQLYEAMLDRLG